MRPSAEHVAAYSFRDPLEMPAEESRRVKVPNDLQPCEPITVRRDHIDTNEHVNNCQYVKMALDALPREVSVREARVDFRRSAVLGDVIYPKLAQLPDRFTVALCDADDALFGVVELKEQPVAR